MRNLLFLSLIISHSAWGQIGIVSSPGRSLEVRDNPGGSIIDTLEEGELFFIRIDSEDSIWTAIEYGEKLQVGFVHQSGILEITGLDSPAENIPELIFTTQAARDSENREFYGGMNLPLNESFELVRIDLVQDGDTIQQDPQYSADVLTPFLATGDYAHVDLVSEGKLKVYSYKDFVYYRMSLGDGSEYYECTWVVRNGRIIQRLIGWIV